MISRITKQAGLSLVELLVSIVVSMIVLAGVIGVVVSSRTTFMTEQEASFMQENIRYAVELMSRDLRQAGNKDCAPDGVSWYANTVSVDATNLFSTQGVTGYEGTADVSSFPTSFNSEVEIGSDAIIVRYADAEQAVPITAHNVGSGTFTLGAHDFYAGQKMFIVDATCRHYGYFHSTAVTATSVTNAGNAGNCSSVMFNSGADSNCPAASASPGSYQAGSFLMPYQVSGYFISESNVIAGVPALKRRVFYSGGQRSEELAQGIESMEIVYGEDITAIPDGEIDIFVDADDVADWNNVISARFTFILRSQSAFFPQDESVTLAGRTFNDRFLRQVLSTTVRIRN